MADFWAEGAWREPAGPEAPRLASRVLADWQSPRPSPLRPRPWHTTVCLHQENRVWTLGLAS